MANKFLKSITLINGLVQAVDFQNINASDVIGLGTAALKDTGTSGSTVPLNNTANVFSGLLTLQAGDGTPTNPTLYLNTGSSVNPVIKWDTVGNQVGLRFYSGSTEIARMQDNGAFIATSFETTGGLSFGSFFFRRGSGGPGLNIAAADPRFLLDGVSDVAASLQFSGKTSTTNSTLMGMIAHTWATATHASRKARVIHYAYDLAAQECLRIEASGSAGMIGVLGAAAVVRQASGADLTNSVTAGGTDDTIANYTDLTLYANDSAAIRNNIYQLARKLKQVNDALRLYGWLT